MSLDINTATDAALDALTVEMMPGAGARALGLVHGSLAGSFAIHRRRRTTRTRYG